MDVEQSGDEEPDKDASRPPKKAKFDEGQMGQIMDLFANLQRNNDELQKSNAQMKQFNAELQKNQMLFMQQMTEQNQKIQELSQRRSSPPSSASASPTSSALFSFYTNLYFESYHFSIL